MDNTDLERAKALRHQGYTLLASNSIDNHLAGRELLEQANALDPEGKAELTEEELMEPVQVDDLPWPQEDPPARPRTLMDRIPLTNVKTLKR